METVEKSAEMRSAFACGIHSLHKQKTAVAQVPIVHIQSEMKNCSVHRNHRTFSKTPQKCPNFYGTSIILSQTSYFIGIVFQLYYIMFTF